MESYRFLIRFALLRLKKLHINFLGFIFLLVLLFVLNNKFEKNVEPDNASTKIELIDSNVVGIAPLVAKIPGTSEGAIPIKLISSLNSNFLYVKNSGYEFRTRYRIIYEKKHFLNFYHKIQSELLINYLITARSKDIQ